MDISKIEDNIREMLGNFSPDTFIYDLLLAYGNPKAAVDRLRKGNLNISKRSNEILWEKRICFRVAEASTLRSTFAHISQDQKILKHDPRFIIASDFETLLAMDTKTASKIEIPIQNLPAHWDFFQPLSGKEKVSIHKENKADVEAAEEMAVIYEEICKLNPNMRLKQNDALALNVFLSRLLFCYFAESTEIFDKVRFTETLANFTREDGSDLQEFFEGLFDRLNSNSAKPKGPKYLRDFPYVNGGLFNEQFKIPKFSSRIRKMIIDSGKLQWSSINPDIFGSMIQAVADPNQRSSLGMHYTSVSNIMKVICPLFLDGFYGELREAKGNKKRLNQLYDRLGKIQIFDPACGSGNFLIIAYKELRLFEIQLLKQLEAIGKHPTFLSQIHLSQFFGIEIDEFACEVAKLSLWIAEHQMNKIAEQTFNKWAPSLPLKEGGHIVCGNATRLDWSKVCPILKNSEIFLLSNPPYQGARKQSPEQKEDVSVSLRNIQKRNNIDYVSCWIYKAAQYVAQHNAKAALVTTNSVTQGMQVSILWPSIFTMGVEIDFAYTSFKWANNAKNNAGVSCVIIGLRKCCDAPKYIFTESCVYSAKNINAYLLDYKNIVINERDKPISWMPPIIFGSMPNDDGHLQLSPEEKEKLIEAFPKAKKFIRKIVGGNEFIDKIEKYCLWINDENLEEALTIDPIKKRIQKVKNIRLASDRAATRKLSSCPHRFGEIRHQENDYILIPRTTSDNRDYIPIGFFTPKTVAKDSAHAIYEADH